jgi:hypothetical protein
MVTARSASLNAITNRVPRDEISSVSHRRHVFCAGSPQARIHVFVLPSADLNRGRHLHRGCSLFSGIAVIA